MNRVYKPFRLSNTLQKLSNSNKIFCALCSLRFALQVHAASSKAITFSFLQKKHSFIRRFLLPQQYDSPNIYKQVFSSVRANSK